MGPLLFKANEGIPWKTRVKEFFNVIKGMHQELIPKIIINGETKELFPLEQGK